MENEVDFRIVQKPVAIALGCPHCQCDIRIPWEELDTPEYWGDKWDDIECPECGRYIQLGEYELD